MRTLKRSGLQQALAGATTLEELYRVVDMQVD